MVQSTSSDQGAGRVLSHLLRPVRELITEKTFQIPKWPDYLKEKNSLHPVFQRAGSCSITYSEQTTGLHSLSIVASLSNKLWLESGSPHVLVYKVTQWLVWSTSIWYLNYCKLFLFPLFFFFLTEETFIPCEKSFMWKWIAFIQQ